MVPVFLILFLWWTFKNNFIEVQFTYLEYKFQHFLVYSQICAIITPVNFRTFLSPQKQTLYPLTITIIPLFLHPTIWPQATTNPLSISVDFLDILYE